MAFDAHANFAVSAVATAPSPATSGTSLVVTSGQGARFPAVPFNAVICPSGTAPDPSNAEVVRVTARSTDTLTITRAQEGSTARSVVVGDLIFAAVTAKTLTDVEQGAGIIACTAYNPGTLVTYSTSTATVADVDATNLAVTFTAPPSGKVLVRLSALADLSSATSSALYWGLREGSTTLAGLAQAINSRAGLQYSNVVVVVTGLTPGSSHTYKWAFATNGNPGPVGHIYSGGETDSNHGGASVLEVHALP